MGRSGWLGGGQQIMFGRSLGYRSWKSVALPHKFYATIAKGMTRSRSSKERRRHKAAAGRGNRLGNVAGVSDERICSDEDVYILSQRVEKARLQLGDVDERRGEQTPQGSCCLATSPSPSPSLLLCLLRTMKIGQHMTLPQPWACKIAFADAETNHHRQLQPSRLPLEVVKLAGLWLAGGSDPLTSRFLQALNAPRVKLNLEGSPTPTSSPSPILNSIQFKPQPNNQANCLSHSTSVVPPTV
jgi:hypothetical protein